MSSSQRSIIVAIVIVVLLSLPFVERIAMSQSPQISNGVVYLNSTQNADGSWGNSPASLSGVVPTTAIALEALRAIEPAMSTNQTSAIAFLSGQNVAETPFLAARVISLSGAGNISADVDMLLARQNEDGGWGSDEGCESDSLDTSLALIALKAANVNSQTVLINGLNYLARVQNPDGGWSLTYGDDSQVFYTANALQALDSLRLQFGVSSFQIRAITYLRAQQKADGGYGNPLSTAFESALTLLAISDSGQTLTAAEGRTVTYLSNTQQANGSWVDDAYSTALALRALTFPQDTDGDGMSDECETANGLNPNDPTDAVLDSDGDGVPNLEECRRRCTRANTPDTDGDGLQDGEELANGSDPCNAASHNHSPVIDSTPVTTAREGQAYSYQVQATDADNNPLDYTLLRAPTGMTVSTTGLVSWTPNTSQGGSHTVVLKVSDGQGGTAVQQFRIIMLAVGVDLTVSSVDVSELHTDPQTLIMTGQARISIQNLGGSAFAGSLETLLFEDRNSNGTYQSGVDVQLGVSTFSGSIDSNSIAQLDVPVSGVVLFRDNLVYAFADSANQVTELKESNNISSSGLQSRYQPPTNDFQAKVKWSYNAPPSGDGVYGTPLVAPLQDTNGDGLVNARDVPAVIFFTGTNHGTTLTALRGDTGAVIFDVPHPGSDEFNADSDLAVGDLDGDGIPEIVAGGFFPRLLCFNNNGTLRWTSLAVGYLNSPTIVDLDGDGHAEILYGQTIFNFDGTIRRNLLQTGVPDYLGGSSVYASKQVPDLDLDGTPEIIAGPSVFDHNGNPIWYWQTFNFGGTWTVRGTLDRGATTINMPNSQFILTDSFTAVANLDDDPFPEIVVVCNNTNSGTGAFADTLWVFEHDGRIKPGFPVGLYLEVINQEAYTLGPPAIADFDGDGQPEIAIPAGKQLTSGVQGNDVSRNIIAVYKRDGSLKWSRNLINTIFGTTTACRPPAAFDFDGDGAAELVYRDEQIVWILNGRDGSVLYEIGAGHRAGQSGNPAIADTDNDGQADIVVPAVPLGDGSPNRKGVFVLSDTKGNWRNARRIWNQWLYHVTNVDEDGGIPLAAANNWQGINNSRTQVSIDGVSPTAAPDLTVSRVTINTQNCPASAGITARVGNGGSLHVAAGQKVNFYSGDPATGGAIIGTSLTTRALYPGEFEDVTLVTSTPPSSQVFATVNEPPEEALTSSPNLVSLPHTWAQSSGFCIGCTVLENIFAYRGIDGQTNTAWFENQFRPGDVIRIGPPFYEVRFQYPVNATSVTIQNNIANFTITDAGFLTGSLSFSNGFSTPVTLNSMGEGTVSFPEQQNVSWIRLTGTTVRSNGPSLSEFIVAGSYREPQFRLKEGVGRDGNNKSSANFIGSPCDAGTNQPPTINSSPGTTATVGAAYSYQVQATDPNNDPLSYALSTAPAGMTVSQNGLISWSPTDSQSGFANVTVQVADNHNASAQQTFAIKVNPNGTNHSPQITSTPPTQVPQGQTLQYDVTVTDADNDVIVFNLKQSPGGATLDQITGHLNWSPGLSQTGAQFFTVEALDGRGGRASQSFVVQVTASGDINPPQDVDGDGYFVPEDCDDANFNINPGRPEIPGNGIDDDCNPDTADTLPGNSLQCALVSDKRSYNSNALAQLTATIRNQNSSLTMAGLQGQLTVRDAGGQNVFSTPLSINNLSPGALFKTSTSFNTTTRAPGAYSANLELLYGQQSVCTAPAAFNILSSAVQGTALSGTISSTPTVIEKPATTALAYQVSNIGNVALTGLEVKVQVVEVSGGTAVQSFSDQTALAEGQSFGNSKTLQSSALTAGDYLIVLQGVSSGTTQTIGSAPLKVYNSTFHLNAAGYTVTEGCGAAMISVTRSGDLSSAATVDYATADASALQRTDYTVARGRLLFAAGETTKSFTVLANEDGYAEGNETVTVRLSNSSSGAGIGIDGTTSLTIIDNDSSSGTTNPIDEAGTFVCQHYHDFLSREADPGGSAYWTDQLAQCGTDVRCINSRRIAVSDAFFFEPEFQKTGAYVFRLYRAAYGNHQPFPNPDNDPVNLGENLRIPSYTVFVQDRAQVVDSQDLALSQLAFADAFVQRPEFLAKYPASLNGADFVDAVLAAIKTDLGVDLTGQRNALLGLFNAGGRAAVMYRLADDNQQTNPINNRALIDAEYNRSFVFTEYAGYLRRDADVGGFLFWLGKVNEFPARNTEIQHAMVCAFITSREYLERFGSVVTHSNQDCGQ